MSKEYTVDFRTLLRDEPKRILLENRAVMGNPLLGTFPMDAEASAMFLSTVGAFVAPEHAVMTPLSSSVQYGEAAFEGVRVYYSPRGPVFPELTHNIARFLYSFVGIDPEYTKTMLTAAQTHDLLVPQRSDREIFREFHEQMERNETPTLGYKVRNPNGTQTEHRMNWELRATAPEGERRFTPYEIDAAIKMLAYLNGLVASRYFPAGLEMTGSGYFRPYFAVDARDGLGVATVKGTMLKACHWGVATLPWGKYLNEQDYKTGLSVLIGPYERIGKDFLTGMKIGGHYVNSLHNINPAALLGFGETLALDRKGNAVEGSAENLFVFMREGDKLICYTPPLHDGPLVGTTRRRFIETLDGMSIPVIYQSLPPSELYKAEAIVLTGTGAQFIHVQKIVRIPQLEAYIESLRIKDPNGAEVHYVEVDRLTREEHTINQGNKAPILEKIQREYERRLIETTGLLEPTYQIYRPEAVATLMGLDFERITTAQERRKIRDEYLRDSFDGRKGENEKLQISQRHEFVARIIARAIQKKGRENELFRFPITRVRQTA